MRDRKLNLSLATGLSFLFLATAASPVSLHAQKRRIAVMSLDVSPDARQKAQQMGIGNDLGTGLSDLVIKGLVTDGKYTVVERAALDKIIKEQNFSNSDRADPNTAVKLGKLAGVDAIVIGSVTQFSGETETKGSGPVNVHGFTIPGQKTQTFTVNVGVTARMIDTSTGTIFASASGTGTAKTTKKSTTGSSFFPAQTDTGSNTFSSSSVGEATNQAIADLVRQIEAAPLPVAAAPPPPPPVARTTYKGIVADVSGATLILTVGTKDGVHVNDMVEISRPSRVVKDPTTGKVLKVITDKLGEAKITEADETSATATYSGTAVVKVKDQVSSAP
jgi:curli biogenesis system outer membrane secretion channel CsgG